METKRLSSLINDFFFGGFLISTAIAISEYLGPSLGGIFAALPIRAASTVFLSGLNSGETMALSLAKGTLCGIFGSFVFTLTLALLSERLGVRKSFILGLILCIIAAFAATPIVGSVFS